jgi:hypothetical protein
VIHEEEERGDPRILDVGDGDEDFEWVLFVGLPDALFDFSFLPVSVGSKRRYS